MKFKQVCILTGLENKIGKKSGNPYTQVTVLDLTAGTTSTVFAERRKDDGYDNIPKMSSVECEFNVTGTDWDFNLVLDSMKLSK